MLFAPPSDPHRNCLTCQHLGHLDYTADAAVCGRDERPAIHVGWRIGCAFWSREPGSDDQVHAVVVDEAAFRTMQRMSEKSRVAR